MILLRKICKTYGEGEVKTQVLKDIDLEIKKGDFIAIMGPSGSGKSTLMNIIGALDRPTSGNYFFEDIAIDKLSAEQRALFRRYKLGFVFQGYNLLKKTSAIENVQLPLVYQGVVKKKRYQMAYSALQSVGLEAFLDRDPGQLSGGQQQRVAIARAIVTKPHLLLADEPTGNLDTKKSHEIMVLLKDFHAQGSTIIMVTHEAEMAAYASKIIRLRDGRIEKVEDVA